MSRKVMLVLGLVRISGTTVRANFVVSGTVLYSSWQGNIRPGLARVWKSQSGTTLLLSEVSGLIYQNIIRRLFSLLCARKIHLIRNFLTYMHYEALRNFILELPLYRK